MANIVLNTNCNLRCPYCFGDDYVEECASYISEGTFEKVKGFILNGQMHSTVGIIGGEPTLHPKFKELVLNLCSDSRVDVVLIYTNGILISKYPEVIENEKVKFLINCNPGNVIGVDKFNSLKSAIKTISKYNDKLSIGVNIYRERNDYTYIYKLLDISCIHRLRVSITVPNNKFKQNPFRYFDEMKPVVLDFFYDLAKRNVVPYFDCNHLPPCFLSEEDITKFGFNEEMMVLWRNTLGQTISCRPVIDIFPDMTAVRCLGMSETTKVNIKDFADIKDLFHYYLRLVDALAHNCYLDKRCANCYKMITTKCTGGCLSYKTKQIFELHEICQEYNERCCHD